MAEDPGSAASTAEPSKTKKLTKKERADYATSDELFARSKPRARTEAEEKLREKLAEEVAKQKLEKEVAPKVLPTTNERVLTYDLVAGSVTKGVLKDPLNDDWPLPYTIKADGQGASAQIWLNDKMVGFIRAGIGPHMTQGKLVAGVETVNVNNEYQKRGLGIVLAIAFYVRSQNGNAGYVELATKDTSGAFWPNLGMHEKVPISIETAKGNVRAFRIRW